MTPTTLSCLCTQAPAPRMYMYMRSHTDIYTDACTHTGKWISKEQNPQVYGTARKARDIRSHRWYRIPNNSLCRGHLGYEEGNQSVARRQKWSGGVPHLYNGHSYSGHVDSKAKCTRQEQRSFSQLELLESWPDMCSPTMPRQPGEVKMRSAGPQYTWRTSWNHADCWNLTARKKSKTECRALLLWDSHFSANTRLHLTEAPEPAGSFSHLLFYAHRCSPRNSHWETGAHNCFLSSEQWEHPVLHQAPYAFFGSITSRKCFQVTSPLTPQLVFPSQISNQINKIMFGLTVKLKHQQCRTGRGASTEHSGLKCITIEKNIHKDQSVD